MVRDLSKRIAAQLPNAEVEGGGRKEGRKNGEKFVAFMGAFNKMLATLLDTPIWLGIHLLFNSSSAPSEESAGCKHRGGVTFEPAKFDKADCLRQKVDCRIEKPTLKTNKSYSG